MPFYEYECPSCRFYTEQLQKISDPPLKKCPSCGKSGIKRLISAPVFRLKGSGWYETDFKSDKEDKRNLVGADRDESAVAPAKADVATADTAKADSAKPEAGKSQSDKNESVKNDSGNSESGKGEAAKTESGRSGARRVGRRPKPKARKPLRPVRHK
jgi:putative FmdB family regulatory protein